MQRVSIHVANQCRAIIDLRWQFAVGSQRLVLGNDREPAPEGVAILRRVEPQKIGRPISKTV